MTFDKDYTMTIDGVAAGSDVLFDVVNPATEQVIGRAPNGGADSVDRAVAAARRAFPAWRDTPFEKRRAIVQAIGAAIAEHAQDLSRLLTREQGKPIADAEFEIGGAAAWCQGVATYDLPVTVVEDSPEQRIETRHVPLGVVGAIVPWNFPILLAILKVAPALLAGNTVVVKPSPFTPLATLKLGEILRAHVPAGVLNIITGDEAMGPLITAHPGIDKVSFTGSTATGKRVMAGAAESLKRVTLELGGNDAAIVLPDVDPQAVAKSLFWAAFRNSGQVCIATKRLYIHADIYEAVKQALCDYAKTIAMGDGTRQGVELGPVQNRPQFERVKALIADAQDQGFVFAAGGDVLEGPGYFIPVTIIDNPPEDSRVVQEEAFGPVLPLLRFHDVDEVVRRANDSPYGLAGSVWSADLGVASEIAARLETGTVWINQEQSLTPMAVFGGHKQSGLGVENGLEGLLEYTNAQTVMLRRLVSA